MCPERGRKPCCSGGKEWSPTHTGAGRGRPCHGPRQTGPLTRRRWGPACPTPTRPAASAGAFASDLGAELRRRVYTHRRRSREPYALRQALRARLELVREAPDQEVDGSCSSWRRGFYCTVSEAKRGSHHKSQQGASTRPAVPTAASAASTHSGGPSGPSRSHSWVKCLPHGQLLRLPARSCHRQNTTGSSFARPLQTTPKPPSATPGMAPQLFPRERTYVTYGT